MRGAEKPIEWDDDTFERVLQRLRTDGTIDAIGVHISAERLARILEAAPEDPERRGHSLFQEAKFEDASFDGHLVFRGSFQGDAHFDRATFKDDALFTGRFEDTAWFNDATFERAADFIYATFKDYASFNDATFQGYAMFEGRPQASGWQPTFQGRASFFGTTFQGPASFRYVTFEDDAEFNDATFKGRAAFDQGTFKGDALFARATFEGARDFGPVLACKALELDGTVFAQPIRIETSARVLRCSRAQFRRGADLLVRRAEVVLDDADFAEPSMLATRRNPIPHWEGRFLVADEPPDGEPAPRLVSLRGAKVANLTITGVDLRAGRFEGAHGLDELRLESVRFAESPSDWQRSKRWRLPTRWTRRQSIAEEHQWRAQVAGEAGWYGAEVQATQDWEDRESRDKRARFPGLRLTVPQPAPLEPEQIAAIYRSLRKGREDSKDEPGAADFYYGEMEMRRQKPRRQPALGGGEEDRLGELLPSGGAGATKTEGDAPYEAAPPGAAVIRTAPSGERIILWLYWLVSGYGLRASRALIFAGAHRSRLRVPLRLVGVPTGSGLRTHAVIQHREHVGPLPGSRNRGIRSHRQRGGAAGRLATARPPLLRSRAALAAWAGEALRVDITEPKVREA